MSRSKEIFDFRLPILDLKSRIQNQKSKIAACFMFQALLALACAMQTAALADGDAESLILPSASINQKSKIQNPKSGFPPANEILAQVRANLPREALLIRGQILSGGRLGKLERVGHVEMFLDFGDDPASACYKINDAFGTTVEQMTTSMAEGGEAEFEYETGNPLQPAAAPGSEAFIRDTDFTWNDLSLLLLWRMDGRTVREESLRGRDCHVIEFPGQAESSSTNSQTVWIDTQMLVLIQMEELDGPGKLRRRMVVKNIKKISDQWMIKDLEIRSYPSLHHTLIRIDEVSPM